MAHGWCLYGVSFHIHTHTWPQCTEGLWVWFIHVLLLENRRKLSIKYILLRELSCPIELSGPRNERCFSSVWLRQLHLKLKSIYPFCRAAYLCSGALQGWSLEHIDSDSHSNWFWVFRLPGLQMFVLGEETHRTYAHKHAKTSFGPRTF